jgi:hypothetical protein
MAYFELSHPAAGTIKTQEIKFKPTICYIDLDADNVERKEGKFGFDILTNKLLRICKRGEKKLKKEYSPYKIEKEEYYIPWLSMQKDQLVSLDVKVKNIQGEKVGEIKVLGNDNKDFTITFKNGTTPSTNVEDVDTLDITCNTTSVETSEIRFELRGTVSGGLNIFHPEPKQFDIRWYIMDERKKGQYPIYDNMEQATLIEWLETAFNPALLKANILNKKAELIDISDKTRADYYDILKAMVDTNNKKALSKDAKAELKEIPKYEPMFYKKLQWNFKPDLLKIADEEGIMDVKTKIEQYALLEDLNYLYEPNEASDLPPRIQKNKREVLMQIQETLCINSSENTIHLFICNISSYTVQDDNISLNGGTARVGKNMANVFYGNGKALENFKKLKDTNIKYEPEVELPHEVMHCLGLEDMFKAEAQLGMLFKKKRTDNYMDYDNTKEHTFKQQWSIMRNSKFTY